jgi:UDP-glucose 4-epimerase
MSKTLVTGGAGFIGSNLCAALRREGHSVRVLDNLVTGRKCNLDGLDLELIEGDVTDRNTVRGAMQDVDVVYHQAALPSVPRSIEDPMATHLACATGTVTVLTEAKSAGVKRLVYAASSSAYGNQPFSSKRECDPAQPLSPYAAAKLSGEYYCRAFFASLGLETVCIRYFNVFGPNQDPNSAYSAVIPLFIKAILNDQQPTIFGDGEQTRDFTFVDNVVHANMLAAAAPAEKVGGQVFNIANGESTSLNQLMSKLNVLLGTSIEPIFAPPRTGDVKHSLADIERAKQMLGYAPIATFDEGLLRSIEYYKRTKGIFSNR